MLILNKPRYKVNVFSRNELDDIVAKVKQNYQDKYPGSIVEVNIEPDQDMISFDGSMKEFSYKATIKY